MRYFGDSVSGAALVLLVLLGSVLFGVVYSTLLGVASINFKADQTLVGTAMNLLGTAGATVIVKAINTAANPDDVSSAIQYAHAEERRSSSTSADSSSTGLCSSPFMAVVSCLGHAL